VQHGDGCTKQQRKVPLLVDGKPCYQAQLHYVHPKISIASNTFFSCGGWHLVKAARKHKCRLFEWLLLPLIKLYGRDTTGRIAWFLDPSDPRQCSNECRAILAAIHVAASIAYRQSLRENEPPSVEGLHDFMRERATICPLARGIPCTPHVDRADRLKGCSKDFTKHSRMISRLHSLVLGRDSVSHTPAQLQILHI
jgi:hypothetical protein